MEKKILFQVLKLKRKVPKVFQEAPSLLVGLELFYNAFWDLVADRYSPQSMIPWEVVQTWADRHALDSYAAEDLHFFLRRMDMEFLSWSSKKTKTKPTDKPNSKAAE